MAMPWFYCLHFAFICLLRVTDCLQSKSDICDSSCAAFSTSDMSYQNGVRYTYRYKTTITTSLHGSNAGRNGLVLDCLVDIDAISECHLMMQIRNPQIKRLSPQKDHPVPRLKSLRESLERTPLKFCLHGGKVFNLCIQEGEQMWTLNIKRAFLSMLQTSNTKSKHSEMETDVHGTCASLYERRGRLLLKTRSLKECHQSRLAHFWTHSLAPTGDTSVQSELRCIQAYGSAVMEEANCTETVSIATWSKTAGQVKTQTESTLQLLRAQSGTVAGAESLGCGTKADLRFEDEGASRPGNSFTPHQVIQTTRMVCSVTSHPQEVSHWFLELTFQLRELTLPQLKTLWREASFKCRNDWQPLLDALPACGSENCVILLTDLMKKKEVEDEQAHSFLTTIAFIPNPSPQIIHSLNTLVNVQEVREKALLAGSSLIHQLCRRSTTPCIELSQVQAFIQKLEMSLKECREPQSPAKVREFIYAMKSVGNMGLAASIFIPLLNHCGLNQSAPLELRLAAIKAFRRFDCTTNRTLLLQLYRSSLEDPEVRIAAYQELMRCPDQDVFEAVKVILRNENSSQVGSFVWSHLTGILRSEDPMKQTFIDSLPNDIISKDFESDFLKYSSYSDNTVTNGMGITNVETTLIFSSKSFLPRSASANLTLYFHGWASNLLEVDFHIENAEPLLKSILGQLSPFAKEERTSSHQNDSVFKETRTRGKINEGHLERDTCLSNTNSYLKQARALLSTRQKMEEVGLKCWVGVKVFGNELSMFTCDDLSAQMDQMSLSAAGLAVKLLKGHEVQLNHRAVLLTEELVLPSLSGLPVKIATNMTSFLSLRLKGNINYRDMSHFSLGGYIKPNAFVGLSAKMGIDGVLGQAAVGWMSELVSSTSLDGSVHMQEGQDLRVTLNTPEDAMDIMSLSSRVFQLSGDHMEEIKGPKSRIQHTACTPKTHSKMVGWQLCANVSLPLASGGISLPPSGPIHLSIRLLKLDRGLHYYLLEAAYSMTPVIGSWFPKEASLHLLLATPKSSIPRDMSLDLTFNPRRFLLRVSHPLKSILVQGQLEQERSTTTAKLELIIDGVHYYVLALVDKQTLISELRTRYHFEANMADNRNPVILSANVTRELGRKMSFSATMKNVFRLPASLSVALERRRDSHSRQYSLEADLLFPDVVGSRILGIMEQKGALWSSALRLKYGLGDDARHLHQECHTSQSVKSERHANLTFTMRADHEFYCSNTAAINHKIHFRHEESPSHVRSSVDMSYGKHWDEINNKRTLLLSQSFKNQTTQNHTSYILEFNLQVPDKDLNYRTQLLHSYVPQLGSDSSTHLKINYNNLTPLVVGLHWKSPPNDIPHKKWEGTFNMDTPWLYIYTTHKLSQHHQHTLQLNSELTANKWVTIRNLILETSYRDRGREKEAHLKLRTPAVTFLQVEGLGFKGKKNMKASCSLSSLWTAPLRGEISLETLKSSLTLQMSSSYGKRNITFAAALITIDKLLKKRQARLSVSLLEPKSAPTEFEFEGTLEELIKDKRMYQKTALLHLRQPFKSFPQKLLLRETFTVDLLKGLYILESRVSFFGMKEIIHTLTIGSKLPSPFVCSALVHPFNTETFPSDCEICVITTSNQTQKGIRGWVRIGSQEKLSFFGELLSNSLHPNRQAIKVRANVTHQLELQIPSFALVEGDVCWSPQNNREFDYVVRGRLKIERQECQLSMQLNGTSDKILLYSALRHPFKSKIPKSLEAKATANLSTEAGKGSSSICVKADGRDKLILDAQVSHLFLQEDKSVLLRLNFSQSLLPKLTDLHVKMAAHMSRQSVSLHGSYAEGRNTLLAQVKGSRRNSSGLQFTVSGKLRHSMTNLAILPSILGLDVILGLSDTTTEGQVRVRVEETFYGMDLSHQEEKEEFLERKLSPTRSWMCVLSGPENVCVNVSRQSEKKGVGEVHIRLTHVSRLLNATGLPPSSSAHVSWDQDESRLSAFVELQAGPEHLKGELNAGRTSQLVPRWEILSTLRHRVEALQRRGLPNSMQVKAHCEKNTAGVDARLAFEMEEMKMIDALLVVGTKNNTAVFIASAWQQIKLLQGIIPAMSQMNCTGDTAADHFSAQCYGDVAGRPVEVRAFRSHRPHRRLCYALSLAHLSLRAEAKGCLSLNGQREFKAHLTHSSAVLLSYYGVPTKCGLRLLLRPGPRRWALGVGLAVGPWITDWNLGMRMEKGGLCGWSGKLTYGSRNVTHMAEMTGRVRLESWCHIWADVTTRWDSVSSSLLLSLRCRGKGRLVLEQIRRPDGDVLRKTSLTAHGQAVKDGLKAALYFHNQNDSIRHIFSLRMKQRKTERSGTFQNKRASFFSFLPSTPYVQGSGHLLDTFLNGSAQLSVQSRSAQSGVTVAFESFPSLRMTLDQNVSRGVSWALAVGVLSTAGQVKFQLESDECSMLLLYQQRRGENGRRHWTVFVHQQCVFLKTLLPSQASMNISINSSGSSTNVHVDLLAQNKQRGGFTLSLAFQPSLSLNASVRHSLETLQALGFPSNGALVISVLATHLPLVKVGLDIGNCHFSGLLDKTKSSEAESNGFSYSVNVANDCPVLQGTIIPVILVLRGSLSGVPCGRMISSSLKADNQELAFELRESCRTPHLSASLTHSFSGLRSRGVPNTVFIEATAPGSTERTGALFLKAGACQIRFVEDQDRVRQFWALQSDCPPLQAQLNGSAWRDNEGKWVAVVDASVDGKRCFLQLVAQPWPELSVEGELRHKLPSLGNFPELSKVRVTGKLDKQQYATEALVLLDECSVRARGFVMSRSGLQGSLVYHNNCSVIQDWGSPDMLQTSGSLTISPVHAESQISMAIDKAELHSLVALKKTKAQNELSLHFNHSVPLLKKLGLTNHTEILLSSVNHGNQSYSYRMHCRAQNEKFNQEMTVEKAFQTVIVKSQFRHTLSRLNSMGLPGNSSIQMAIGSSEGKALTVKVQSGHLQAGLRLNLKCFPMTKEIRAIMWHSFPWLQQRGIPHNIEGLCSTQGMSSQLQSRAQVTLDGHKLLDSGVNVSSVDGRLGVLLSYSPSPSNQTWKHFSLNTAVTAHFKGPLRSISVHAHNQNWRVRLVADVAGWGLLGVSKEARVTLKHIRAGDSSPALQVEAWGRLSGSQLKSSMALNPELASSLAIIIQGHHLPNSKDLLVKVVQSIPKMQIYLPSQLNFHSQLNQSQSGVGGLVELLSGKRRLWSFGELAVIDGGYRQSLELKHTYPQLKLLPRNVAVKSVYEARNWSYLVQHGALWGKQELSLSGLYTAPPSLQIGNQTLKVQMKWRPRLTSLEVARERSLQGCLDSVSLGWMRNGRLEQVKALSLRSRSREMNETKLELNQPFSSLLSQLSLHTLSHGSERERRSFQQTQLSWLSGMPVNISISLNKRWQLNSSRGQACAHLSTQTIVASPVKGCVSVSQEGNLLSQNAELKWDNRSVKQGMKYQKGARGMHSLHVNIGLDKVSPAPCPSHSVLMKIQTNLKDRFEYTVLLALCPPQPTLSWSGSHRLNSGEELFYTQSRLSVTGRPNLCSLTLTLTNSSTVERTNVTLFTESRMGNWSVEVGASALSWLQGSALLVRTRLDHRDEMWLNGTLEGRCLQTTAGYKNGTGLSENVSVVACLGTSRNLMLAVQKRDGSSQPETLGSLSAGAANRRLTLTASGCVESLTAVEARIQAVGSQVRRKLLERIQTMKYLLAEFRQRSRDGELLQDVSAVALRIVQQAESLLGHRSKSLLAPWHGSSLRHIVTTSLPRYLHLLQHTSLLAQLELRKPLATLAGVYQDVKGQRLEAVWREAVVLWTDKILKASPALRESPQLRPLARGSMATLSRAMDLAGQHTYHWIESKLAVAFSGFRKQLASLYRYSPSECSVAASLSLPPLRWTRVAEAGLVGILLEEWLLKPLQSLATIRPTAELYRLKRKIMDSPFIHQALLVADQFVVTFDGHLYELPPSCPLLLAQDISSQPSFTLVLNSHSHNLLLLRLNNSTVRIQRSGEVNVQCNKTVTHMWRSDGGVTVRKGSRIVQVSSRNGVSVSCDLRIEVCSLTLDGWLHGKSTGLLGTNDNEAGNDSPLRGGSQAENMKDFINSWQVNSECARPTAERQFGATRAVTCGFLFSSADSPLSSCFGVVDPGQFSLVCESSSSTAPCRLASAFVHLCQHNYIPLEVPAQCVQG